MPSSETIIIPALAAACMLLLGAPFAFKLIPRNPVFGFKTAWTLSDDDVWVAVNARVGRDFMVVGTLMGIHAVLLWKGVYVWRWGNLPILLVILGGLGIILLRGFRLARRMAQEKETGAVAPRQRRDDR